MNQITAKPVPTVRLGLIFVLALFLMPSLTFATPPPPRAHQQAKNRLTKTVKFLQIASDRMQQLLTKKPRRNTRRKLKALAQEVEQLSKEVATQLKRFERGVRADERDQNRGRSQRALRRCDRDLEACETDLSVMRRVKRPPVRKKGPVKLGRKAFRTFLKTISNESFDRRRLALLQDGLTDGVYFDSQQALQLVTLFSFDSKRAEAAVLLCPATLGKDAFLSLVSAIDHESNRQMFRTATKGGCGLR